MDQESGSSKGTDRKRSDTGEKVIPPAPIDYAATGARPKTYPYPGSVGFAQAKKSRSHATRQTSKDDSGSDDRQISPQNPPPLVSATKSKFNDDPENYDGEKSTVEITMNEESSQSTIVDELPEWIQDLKLDPKPQLQSDEEYARSLEWQEMAESESGFTESGFGGSTDAGGFGEGASVSAETGSDSGGFNFKASTPGPSAFPTESSVEERDKCPYCNREYSVSFLTTHAETLCIDNPAVAENRRATKLAVDESMLDEWRSNPNPSTQPEWTTYIPDEKIEEDIYNWSTGATSGYSSGFKAAAAAAKPTNVDTKFNAQDAVANFDDDALIPCELCGNLWPAYAIIAHEVNCKDVQLHCKDGLQGGANQSGDFFDQSELYKNP